MARYRKINGEWFDTSSGLPQVEAGWIKFGEGSASNNEINIPIPKNASELLFIGNDFSPTGNDGMSILIPVQKLRDTTDAYKIGYDPDGSSRHNMLVYLDNSKIIKIRVRNSTTDVSGAKYTMYYKPATFIGKKEEVYSTDEQVIGTWIDGKPLYRKTFILDTAISGVTTISQEKLNVKMYKGRFVFKSSGNTCSLMNYNATQSYIVGLNSIGYSDEYKMYVELFLGSSRTDTLGLELTLEYTKTTD